MSIFCPVTGILCDLPRCGVQEATIEDKRSWTLCELIPDDQVWMVQKPDKVVGKIINIAEGEEDPEC